MLLLIFDLDDRRYALHLEAVERVIRAVEITPLPDAPEDILGVINVYGRIVPVLDVRKRIGLPGKAMALNDHLIITQSSKWPLALLVDRVSEVLDCAVGQTVLIEKILPDGRSVEGVVKVRDGIAFVEDLDRFHNQDAGQWAEAAPSG